MPAFLKDINVSLTYALRVLERAFNSVGHAAGGGCLFGSAQESEKWKSR